MIALLVVWPAVRYGNVLYRRGVRLSGKVEVSSAPGLLVLCLVFFATNVLLLKARSYPAISWYLPGSVEYWSVPGLWTINLATIVFMFVAVFTLAARTKSKLRWFVPFFGVCVLAVAETVFQGSPLVRPPELGSPRLGKDGVIMQSNGSTCAAAACANIAGYLGKPKTEAEMVALLGTTDAGTSPAQVVYGMSALGFQCRKHRVPDGDISRIRPPAVIFVHAGTEADGHAAAYIRMEDGRAEIWDPSSGKALHDPKEFVKKWGGRAVEISGSFAIGEPG